MNIFEVDVKKTIQFAVVPLTNGRSILYSRWKDDDKKFFSCVVKNEDIESLSLCSTPEEISELEDKIEVGKDYDGDPSYGHLYLVYCDPNDIYKNLMSYKAEDNAKVYNHRQTFGGVPEDGCSPVYFCSYNNTVYGLDGKLLNSTYTDSVTEDAVDIYSILRDEEILKPFMEIVPDRYGKKVYYVNGNGNTISYKFNMTPEEYRRFIMGKPSYDRFRKFMSHKLGDVAEMYFVNDY